MKNDDDDALPRFEVCLASASRFQPRPSVWSSLGPSLHCLRLASVSAVLPRPRPLPRINEMPRPHHWL